MTRHDHSDNTQPTDAHRTEDHDTEPTWEETAAHGSKDELLRWASDSFHVDLTDDNIVLNLAANAIQRGAWRNNSELEDIHAGAYKRPGQKSPRGLSDAEMMIGNIETSHILRTHLATGDRWWYLTAEDDLFNFDRPYAGTPLSDHVTKKVLAQHRKQVKDNLWKFRCVERCVGWDRFLLGLALSDLSEGVHHGSPIWPTQVTTWAADADPQPSATLVEAITTDPTQVPADELATAINSGIGYAHGTEHWHQQHCGDPNHRPSPALGSFLGITSFFTGIPEPWMYAAIKQRTKTATANDT